MRRIAVIKATVTDSVLPVSVRRNVRISETPAKLPIAVVERTEPIEFLSRKSPTGRRENPRENNSSAGPSENQLRGAGKANDFFLETASRFAVEERAVCRIRPGASFQTKLCKPRNPITNNTLFRPAKTLPLTCARARCWRPTMSRWIVVPIVLFLLSAFVIADTGTAQESFEVIDPEASTLPATAPVDASAFYADDAPSDGGCETCGGAQGVCFWAQWLHGTCDMPPRYPYFPSMHGYYYFRPYNHMHVMEQQAVVIGWGGDARNPYGNEIFKEVYAEYRAGRDTSLKSVIPPIPEDPIPEDAIPEDAVLEEPKIGN